MASTERRGLGYGGKHWVSGCTRPLPAAAASYTLAGLHRTTGDLWKPDFPTAGALRLYPQPSLCAENKQAHLRAFTVSAQGFAGLAPHTLAERIAILLPNLMFNGGWGGGRGLFPKEP